MVSDEEPKLLSSGNPQIPKGYGDEPIIQYIEALPGWKRDVVRRLDEIIEHEVPKVAKGIKWNTPFYGLERDLWFLSLYAYKRYIQIAFFRGTSLDPVPPKAGKQEQIRYLDIYESDEFEDQVARWVRQAKALPGERI